jgi:PAS domain S-box-containing protein
MSLEEVARLLADLQGAVLAISSDGRIVHASNAALAMLGWDRALVGEPLATIFPERLQGASRSALKRYVNVSQLNRAPAVVRLPIRVHNGPEVNMDFSLRSIDTAEDMTLLVAAMSLADEGEAPPGVVVVEPPMARRMNELV